MSRRSPPRESSDQCSREASGRRWRFDPALADGRAALLATALDDPNARSIILVEWEAGRIVTIHDFLYASYIMDGIAISTF